MNFLLHHDVPDDVVYSLLALGHDVHKLRDVLPATTADEEVLRTAAALRDGAGETARRLSDRTQFSGRDERFTPLRQVSVEN